MAYKDPHIPEQDLLLAADGELPGRRMAEVQAHLKACWSCRTRMKEMDNAVTDFVRLYRQSEPELPPSDGSRALLRARLAQVAAEPRGLSWFQRARLAARNRIAYAGAAVVALFFIGVIANLSSLRRGGESSSALREHLQLPDLRFTPGATVRLSAEELCSLGDVDRLHTVPQSLARETFNLYGIRRPQSGTYEVDYLITPALGGADDVRNLWPQPYSTGVWNSRHKDALEDHLRQLVCGKDLPLDVAQYDIARDWIAAYKKYFRTEVPIAEHLAFVKDQPWQD